MKQIRLTQGKVALVDDEDYEWLSQWKWFARKSKSNWYAGRRTKRDCDGKQSTIHMHRAILGLTDPKILGDHEDGDGLNNQRYNLRQCSHAESARNTRSYGITSNHKGVHLHKRSQKWYAQINVDGKTKHIGSFSNEIEAALAYNEAALKYHGEFARLNNVFQKHKVCHSQ